MPNYLITAGLPSLPSGLDDDKAALVTPLYLAVARLAQLSSTLTGNVSYDQEELSFISSIIGLTARQQNVIIFKAAVDIAFGKLISIYDVGGVITAKLADCSVADAPAHGVCDMPGGVVTGSYGKAIFMYGLSSGVGGTTVGKCYWSSTAGLVQNIAPGSGRVQRVGTGLGTKGFHLSIEQSN